MSGYIKNIKINKLNFHEKKNVKMLHNKCCISVYSVYNQCVLTKIVLPTDRISGPTILARRPKPTHAYVCTVAVASTTPPIS